MARPQPECIKPAPPPGLALSQLPTIKGTVEAWEWVNKELGVAFRLNHIVTAAKRRELRSAIIRHTQYFSTQDLFDWVVAVVRAARAREDIERQQNCPQPPPSGVR
jgi:hypothetical protein